MYFKVFYSVMVFIIGTVFGSFFNVVGYRVPNKMSIIYPDSHCPNCNHKLRFYELIPILSYIFLKGKCKVCKKRISIVYPFFEALTGILFLLAYLVFGFNIKFLISVTFISTLIMISISDLKYYIIPDEVLIVGIVLVIIELFVNAFINNISLLNGVLIPVLNGIGAFLVLYLFKLFGDYAFKKESLGGGDIKLLFFIGLVLGFDMSIVTIFLSSFIALPLSVIGLIKNDNNIIPFGPYLSISATIILLSKMNLDSILSFFTSR